MKRKLLIFFVFLFLICVLYYIGTGFLSRSNIALTDYSVSEDDTIHLKVSVTTSMGYTRGFRAEENGRECNLTFYSTFGGLNSSLGAKSEFDLTVSPDCETICFFIGNGSCQQVLVKENGQWQRPE